MATIPVDVRNFVRAESDLMFSRIAQNAGGVGAWQHFRKLSPLDEQPVIRQNRDTLYSAAIVDVRDGVTVTLPDGGERYLSVMVVSQDHFIPQILHAAGEHEITRETVGTDYALLAARILIDPNDPADAAEVNRLQDAMALTAVRGEAFPMPEYDQTSHSETRRLLLDLARPLPDFVGAFGRPGEVEPIRHLLGSAAGWGGLPSHEAIYMNIDPRLPVAEYRMRFGDVPVDAFWSVSLYNAEGYFEANALGVHSINSITAERDADGAVTIRFGGDPQGEPNYMPIMPGWNLLLRLYRPREEILSGAWTAPQIEAL